MKNRSLSALDFYMNRVFKTLILGIPIVALIAGATFSAIKLLGYYPELSTRKLMAFDLSCLLYFGVGCGFVRFCEDREGNLKPHVVTSGKIFICIVEFMQWNFIAHMVPSRDFWAYAVFFVMLVCFFLDSKMTAVVIGEISVSLVLSFLLRAGYMLPAEDENFIPEMILRCVLVALSFAVLFLLTYFVQTHLVRELEKIADYDALTLLFNRRGLGEKYAETAAQAQKIGKDFTVLMCDLDNFKKVNDTFGHACGDEVLKNAANIVMRAAKEEGCAVRYGGEEILVMIACEKDRAEAIAEEIRAGVEGSPVTFHGQTVPITITVGMATVRDTMTMDDVMQAADAALYYGKKHGKNQVVK